jgi:long-chain acyl-CoA synthetase
LPQDLGFDSLMWVELATALEPLAGKLDPEVLVTKETVSAVESYLREASSSAAKRPLQNARDDVKVAKAKDDALRLPGFLKAPARAAITMLQREAYRTLFSSTVVGRSRIPYNRNTIVVANHTSHLDTGLVKFALGRYGKDLRPLAAKDYFFEGNRAKVAFFTELTNLVPIDRETGSGLAFEQALDVIEAGHVVLIFPEGTRREDGALGAFKPLVARLSLMTGVDVLPLHMQGNFDALPRGSVVPNLNARDLKATIGLPLAAREMARLTAHLPNVQAARAATEIIRAAIVALSEGRVLDLERVVSLDRVESGVRVLHDDSEAQATA